MITNLPKNWKLLKLKDVCHKKGEYGSGAKAVYYDDNKPRYIRITDIDDSGNLKKENIVSPSKIEEKYFLENGDILFARSGSVGKTYLYKESDGICQYAGYLIRFKPNYEIIDSNFLYYITKSSNYWNWVESTKKTMTISNINAKMYSELKIPVPPIETQRKIIKILKKAEKLKELRAEADKLTEEYLKSVFLEMFGDPVSNPKNWEISKLSDFGVWKSGGTPSRKNKKFFVGNIPWYTSGELNSMYISSSIENINEKAIDRSNAKLIQPNSLLLGMYDTAALKSSITTIPSSSNQAIAFSELEKNNSNIYYVYFAIQTGRKFFMSRQRGIRQKNLNLTMIKETEIPNPPLNLQIQFAEIVLKVENIKNYQIQSKVKIDNLFNALMQKAFKGELTC